uniref:CBS domain-containing protein n=1 Tax=Spongospora subterranea TaxID=70186 RepID=A0A0H5QN21_9EUKA|eukprot:CRZ03375.1 hypothetical protein [Spongospora subterranea]
MTTVRPPKVENVPLQNPIWNALQQFTIGDVLVPRSVTFIEPWMPIEDVLALMSSKGYMSLPVLNSNGGIAGVVDVIDVVAFYASVFAKVRAQQPPEQKKYENKNGQDIPPADELVLRRPKTVDPKFKPPKLPAIFEDDWMNNPIGSLVNYSRRHSPLYVHRSMLLSDLVQTLTNGKHHRVMVLVDDPISPVPHPFEIVAVIRSILTHITFRYIAACKHSVISCTLLPLRSLPGHIINSFLLICFYIHRGELRGFFLNSIQEPSRFFNFK